MLEHMKTPLTDGIIKSYAIPKVLIKEVETFMKSKGIDEAQEEVQEYYSIEELFNGTKEELHGSALRGARYKEELTQVQLAERTGINRRHISEYENGKRSIGKQLAKKFAEVLKVDYRIFL